MALRHFIGAEKHLNKHKPLKKVGYKFYRNKEDVA